MQTRMLDRIYPARKEFGWIPVVWLMYLVFLFIDPVLTHRSRPLIWVGTILTAVVFVPLYLHVQGSKGWRAGLQMFAMVLLAVVCMPWNAGAIGFFIYAAACLPWVSKGSTVWVSLAGIVGAMLVESRLLHFANLVPLIMSLFAICVCAGNYHLAQKKCADRKLQMAHGEIEHLAKVAERERIARDLHDLLGHTLSVITLKSELARRLVDLDPQRARQEMLDVEQTSRAALAEVREAISGFRGQGLASELIRSRKTLEAAGVELETDISEAPLTMAQETVLTLVLREATTNVVRHAQAQHCRIRIEREDEVCKLEIVDDGRGSGEIEGNGLRGMRERIEAIGGSLQRRTEAGTRIVISLPIAQAALAVRN
jgi:two-component system, NarL family, sensor histidine kinase DesK